MKILITGAGGFVGQHLAESLVKKKHMVFAATRKTEPCNIPGTRPLYFDLTEPETVELTLAKSRPDGIIHLAAQSQVKKTWSEPALTMSVNVVGTLNLLETVARVCPGAKMITVGSGEEYGATAKNGKLLTEVMPCFPQNPYAVSKFAAGLASLQVAARSNLKLIHVRAFNHFGPGQGLGFVVSDFASQLAAIEKGKTEPVIYVGDLSAERDFTYISDIISAYVRLLESDVEAGIYNVCSGHPRSISDLLNILLSKTEVPITVKTDRQRFRPSEVPFFAGSAEKLKHATGWQPEHSIETGLNETLNWWRSCLIAQ